jgi:hypothetical protein
MAIHTPHALQNARLGGLGTPQSQHSTDGGAGSGRWLGVPGRLLEVPCDGRPPEDEERGTGAVSMASGGVAKVPATDATASVGRGEAARATSESHSAQKLASGLAGVPHMGHTDGVSTPGVCGRRQACRYRQWCVAAKY